MPISEVEAISELRQALRERAEEAARRAAEEVERRRHRRERAIATAQKLARGTGALARVAGSKIAGASVATARGAAAAAKAGVHRIADRNTRLAHPIAVDGATPSAEAEPEDTERDNELEALDRHQLMVRASKLGDHPDVAMAARIVAAGYVERGWYFQAAELYVRARSIIERAYGPDHPETRAIDEELSQLLAETDQSADGATGTREK